MEQAAPLAETDSIARRDAVRQARQFMAVHGPDIAWSILLEAELGHAPDGLDVRSRLADALAALPQLGTVPHAVEVAPEEVASVRSAFANEPYRNGDPVLRLAVSSGPTPLVLLAAHHGAIDGLGLLGLMGAALGLPLRSSVRGVDPGETRPPAGGTAGNLLRAVLLPPSRVASARGRRTEGGDHLVAVTVPPLTGGTARLAAAAVRAVVGWNAARGQSTPRPVVAIGASYRSGEELTLDNRAAWLRIPLANGEDGHVADAFARGHPLPVPPPWRGPRLATAAVGVVSERIGSTLLISNLGAVSETDGVRALAFYPVAHGRRAVAVGAASVAGRSVVTLRVPRRSFGAEEASRFAGLIAAELGSPSNRT